MSLGGAFGLLGRLFDHWEGDHWTISHVGMADGVASTEEDVQIHVELRTSVHTLLDCKSERTSAERSVTIDSDGALEYTVRTPFVPNDVIPCGTRVDTTDTQMTDDGSLIVSLAISIPASLGLEADLDAFGKEGSNSASASESDEQTRPCNESTAQADRESLHEQSFAAQNAADTGAEDKIERSQPDVPAYKDTAYLHNVYEAFDTFAEMAAEVDMDVTDETIRRYMIDAGVHQPTRYNTGSESVDQDDAPTSGERQPDDSGVHEPATGGATGGGEETPVVVTDGIGLPEGLSADEFIEIVKNSRTLYEVQQEMGVERTTARDLLTEYNLLDFVMGQLALESELYVTREDVIDRIRESVSP